MPTSAPPKKMTRHLNPNQFELTGSLPLTILSFGKFGLSSFWFVFVTQSGLCAEISRLLGMGVHLLHFRAGLQNIWTLHWNEDLVLHRHSHPRVRQLRGRGVRMMMVHPRPQVPGGTSRGNSDRDSFDFLCVKAHVQNCSV